MGNGNEEMRKWNNGNESHMNRLAWVRACLVREGVSSSRAIPTAVSIQWNL